MKRPSSTAPASPEPERRARVLLRLYPPSWRARYGDEFTALLTADLAEQPRSWRSVADVVRSGLRARLACAGLVGHPLDEVTAARASLAAGASALAAFLVLGAALWAQLTIGWQWAPPASPATTVAVIVMSVSMGAFAVLAALAAAPVLWAAARACRAGASRRLRVPALLLVAGATVLVFGGRHFGNGWPGTGGHAWPLQHLVPGGVAAFAWACTLPVTSYWAHPGALAAFPAGELAWMALSPVAIGCVVAGAALLIRRTPLSGRALRYEAWLGRLAGVGMSAFTAAAMCWLTEGSAAPRGLFHAGVIDAGCVAGMTVALIVGWQAVRRAQSTGMAATEDPAGAR